MFNVFSKILKQQDLSEEDLKKFNSFMMCRWLSGSSKTIQLANLINSNYKIPDNCQIELVKEFAKQNNIKFVKFPSFKTAKQDVNKIQELYKISYEKAILYSEILNKGA